MAGKKEIPTGTKFNFLKTISFTRRGGSSNKRIVDCICSCGKLLTVKIASIKNGHTKSCGCHKINEIVSRSIIHGEGRRRQETIEFSSWKGMKQRCYNKNAVQYMDWGGRGITVCDRWINSYQNFLTDMGRKPSKEFSLDRINNNGNYEPSNCRWADRTTQNRNQRVRKDARNKERQRTSG